MISQFDEASQSGRLVKRQVPTKNVFSFLKLMNMEISNQSQSSFYLHAYACYIIFNCKDSISSGGFKCSNIKALVFLQGDDNQVTFFSKVNVTGFFF